MTRFDKIAGLAIWACLLGFIAYQLAQEIGQKQQCSKAGGVTVISSTFYAVCVPLQKPDRHD